MFTVGTISHISGRFWKCEQTLGKIKRDNFIKHIKHIKQHWLIGAMLVFLAFYFILFLATLNGREEIIVESGQTSFTATMSEVAAVIPCNNDTSLQEMLDSNGSDVRVIIQNEAGDTVTEVSAMDADIHTNGYNSTENLQMEGTCFSLEKGQTYTLQYEARCGDTELTDLSFVLYGEEHKLPVLLAAVLGLLICVIVIVRVCRCTVKGYRLLWLALAAVFLVSMPKTNEKSSERTAFANAYAASNLLLGQDAVDVNGYVYIEESGIRNMGYLSYSVPLHRFWSDWKSGNERETGKVSSLYQVRSGTAQPGPSVLSYIDGGMIALARICRAPYQIVYLSGKLLHMLLCFLLFCGFLSAWEKGMAAGNDSYAGYELLPALFLLPSMLQSAQSYSWCCIVISAVLLFVTICVGSGRIRLLCRSASVIVIVFVIQAVVRAMQHGENVLRIFVNQIMLHADDWAAGIAYYYSVSPDSLKFPMLMLDCVVLYVFVILPFGQMRGRVSAAADQDSAEPSACAGGSAASAEELLPAGSADETDANRWNDVCIVILFLALYIGWKCIA